MEIGPRSIHTRAVEAIPGGLCTGNRPRREKFDQHCTELQHRERNAYGVHDVPVRSETTNINAAMKYDELPVYKACYDLILQVFRSSQHMKREYRYTLGEELKKVIIELIIFVYRANITHDKEQYIAGARERIEVARLQIRLLHDLGQMPVKNMTATTLNIESISKQLAAWHRSENEKLKLRKNKEEESRSR